MKTALIIAIGALTASPVYAQTVEEWFRQKETQINYLVEQITALKAFGAVVNRGYDIAQNGLGVISLSKEGDYGQHTLNFNALWNVKYGIQNYGKVLSIYQLNADIDREQRLFRASVTSLLPLKESAYLDAVSAQLMAACGDLMVELSMVVTDDRLQLRDDERIRRIDKIYAAMQDHQRFSKTFIGAVKQHVRNREEQTGQLKRLSALYQLK